MTLLELCDWYFKTIQRTIEGNQWRLSRYVLPKLGQKKLKELKPAMLAAHFAELQKNGGYGIKYRLRPDYDLKAAIHAMGHLQNDNIAFYKSAHASSSSGVSQSLANDSSDKIIVSETLFICFNLR
jgi:hypothetical protein